MKKSIYLLALLLLSGAMYAQQLLPFVPGKEYQNKAVKRVPYPKSPVLQQTTKGAAKTTLLNERWYNYVEASQAANSTSGLSDPFINYMFPDSTIQAQFGSTVGDPFVHGYALMLDPGADVFGNSLVPGYNDLTILRSGTSTSGKYSYILDSLDIPYFYQRPASMPTSIADTVIIQIIPCTRYRAAGAVPGAIAMSGQGGGSLQSWSTYYFHGASFLTNFGEDTVYFTSIGFNQNTWRVPVGTAPNRVYKIPLGISDTTNGALGKSIKLAMASQGYTTPYAIPGTKVGSDSSSKNLLIFMYYKPGQSWGLTDMLDVNISNATRSVFSPLYIEENGDDTYPLYDGNTFLSERPHAGFVKGYNISYMLPSIVRYKVGSGWGAYGIMIPHVAYTQPYAFEYPLWYAKIRGTGTPTSINVNSSNDVVLGQAYPNPTRTEINIPYALNNSTPVEITITNMMGQTVNTVANQTVSAGKYVTTVDVSTLPAGMYFYTVKTNNGVQTSKFVVE